MNQIIIKGWGHYHPLKKVSNFDFEEILDTSDEWISQRTGIKNRYFSEIENTSELAYKASLKAIEQAGINASKIDAIIVATMTPDYFTPSCACLVQAKLGLNDKDVFCLDVNGACSGFVYALQLASDLLNSYSCILVIGAEVLSKVLDFNDRSTCVLFGDGSGAMIIERGGNGFYSFASSKGNDQALFCLGPSLVKNFKNASNQDMFLKMDGNQVFKFALDAIKKSIFEVLSKANLNISDIDLIIPHQANYRIIKRVAKELNIPIDKFFLNLQEYGNTSSASIPIAFSCAKDKGLITEESNIILVGFGAGLTYGACLMRGIKC